MLGLFDDIFCANRSEIDANKLKNNFGYLKLNIESSNEVNFLDLIISFDSDKSEFKTNLYIKPTNTFSYLLKSSNHPNHIFKNIPKSLFIRIRRICSCNLDYIFHSKILILQLYKRGYNYFKLKSIAKSIYMTPRVDLLQYKSKQNNILNKNKKWITLFQKYDYSLLFLKNVFSNAFYKMKYSFENRFKYLNNLFLKFNFSIGTNIGYMLVHGFKIKNLIKKYDCTKCNTVGCNICIYLKENNCLRIKNYVFPVLSECNCLSIGIIYILICKRCNVYYIGESQRIANKRLTEHVKKIVNFNNDLDKAIGNLDRQSEIGIHFNCSFHNLRKDLKIFILDKNINVTSVRKSKETDLINIFKIFKIPLLNRKIPDINYIKNLFFYSND